MPRSARPGTQAESATDPDAARRSWRPVLWVLLGALIAVVAVVVVDRAGSSDSEQAAPTTTGPTTTTAAAPVAPRVFRTIQPSLVLVQATNGDGSTSLGSGVIVIVETRYDWTGTRRRVATKFWWASQSAAVWYGRTGQMRGGRFKMRDILPR